MLNTSNLASSLGRHIEQRLSPRRYSAKATPLHTAVQQGDEDAVRACLEDADVDIEGTNGEGLTALHLGCQTGHVGCVALLLKKGAIGCSLSRQGKSPPAGFKLTD